MRSEHAERPAAPLLLAHLSGTHAQMGAQLGAMTRAAGDWEPVLAYYPRMAEILLMGSSPKGRVAVRPLVEAWSARLERDRPQALRDRTRAFLSALGVRPELSRYFSIMDVFQNIVNLAGRYELGPFAKRLAEQAPAACSTLVAWGAASEGGALRHARNFDFPGLGIWDKRPSVVFCSPSEGLRYGFVGVRGGDVPCVSAFNEAGITLTTHTRFHREARWSGAGIVDLSHEVVQHARTLAEAEAILRRRPIASTWGLCVSSAQERRAASFEVHGGAVHRVDPEEGRDHLAVTNRYVHPKMKEGEVTISPAFVRNSDGRWCALCHKVAQGQPLDVHALQALLGSHADAEQPGAERPAGGVTAQVLTVHSVVVEPERQAVHVSLGPAPTSLGPWVEVPWRWQDGPSLKVERFEPQALTTHDQGRFGRGAPAQGLARFLEASAIAGQGGDPQEAKARLMDAVRTDPQETTYRLLAGGAFLQAGDPREALLHFREALAHERSPFYRGQLLLWASRAAHAAHQHDDAARWRKELSALDHPNLDELRASARREAHAPLDAAKLKRLRLNYHLAELHL